MTNSVNTKATKEKKIGMMFQHILKRLAIVEDLVVFCLFLQCSRAAHKGGDLVFIYCGDDPGPRCWWL